VTQGLLSREDLLSKEILEKQPTVGRK
jgi:hypothetical protein